MFDEFGIFDKADSKRILAIVAHGDDEVIGCGGLLNEFAKLNASVRVYIACLENRQRYDEAKKAADLLSVDLIRGKYPEGRLLLGQNQVELQDTLVDLVQEFRPHLVVTHDSVFDGNEDHKVLSKRTGYVLERASHGRKGWCTSMALSFEIHSLFPFPNLIVDITSNWEAVTQALNAYESQINAPHKRGYYPEYLDRRSLLRGIQTGVSRGEAYRIMPINTFGYFRSK